MNDTTQTPVAPRTLRERVAAWLVHIPLLAVGALLSAVALVFVVLLTTCSTQSEPKPEATQPTPLTARIEALEAQVADLQEPPIATAPMAASRRAPTRLPAEPAPAPSWGTTDLDREISDFTQSITTQESAK